MCWTLQWPTRPNCRSAIINILGGRVESWPLRDALYWKTWSKMDSFYLSLTKPCHIRPDVDSHIHNKLRPDPNILEIGLRSTIGESYSSLAISKSALPQNGNVKPFEISIGLALLSQFVWEGCSHSGWLSDQRGPGVRGFLAESLTHVCLYADSALHVAFSNLTWYMLWH